MLLSVGYSACHWCHVMERESFENENIAALMNQLFVNIKVDREERPDVDQIYMQAVQSMTGHGGWPMTVFLTPDGVPFYGGTYFPPEDRHGMPAFPRLLQGVAEAYRARRGEVVEAGKQLLEQMTPGRASAELGVAPHGRHPLLGLPGSVWRVRRAGGRHGARAQVSPAHELGIPPALLEAHGHRAGAGHGRPHPDQDGPRRHVRSARRRLPSLLGGRPVAGAALREDALRQCPARLPLPARLARHGRPRVPARVRGDARLRPARDDACLGRLLLRPGRRLRRRRGQVLRLVGRGDRRRAR